MIKSSSFNTSHNEIRSIIFLFDISVLFCASVLFGKRDMVVTVIALNRTHVVKLSHDF